ncbi:MAG: hypothetical protein ACOH2L_16395 [Devosia sp.]
MSLQNTMISGDPATLSEQQLFAAFVTTKITKKSNYELAASSYLPEEYLLNYGELGEFEETSLQLTEQICEDDNPNIALDRIIGTLKGYVEALETVECDFHKFMKFHETGHPSSDEPADPQDYDAWCDAWNAFEQAPRYSLPAVAEEVA